MRQPGRTLITAAALTVGLALVAFVAVLAAGFKATIDHAVDRSFAGNLIVENSQSRQRTGDPAAASPTRCARCRASPKSRRSPSRSGARMATRSNEAVTAVEPASFAKAYKLEWKHGSTPTLRELVSGNEAIVTEEFAKSHRHLKLGETLHAADADAART